MHFPPAEGERGVMAFLWRHTKYLTRWVEVGNRERGRGGVYLSVILQSTHTCFVTRNTYCSPNKPMSVTSTSVAVPDCFSISDSVGTKKRLNLNVKLRYYPVLAVLQLWVATIQFSKRLSTHIQTIDGTFGV